MSEEDYSMVDETTVIDEKGIEETKIMLPNQVTPWKSKN